MTEIDFNQEEMQAFGDETVNFHDESNMDILMLKELLQSKRHV